MKLLVGTRKGLFTLLPATSSPGGWAVDSVDFLGEPVFAGVVDPTGTTYAALGTGHFGAHVWRRDEPGGAWVEVGAPAYPPRPDDATDVSFFTQEPWPWALELIWTIELGHPSRPGELWAGTLPGALFRSRDRGDSWEMNEPLWTMPERSQWSGGGFDWPGTIR